jgi:hypothetical protein
MVAGEGGCKAQWGPSGHPSEQDTSITRNRHRVLTPLTWRGPGPRFHESLWGVLHKLSYLNALDHRDLKGLLRPQLCGSSRLERLRSFIGLEHGPQSLWSLQSMEPILTPKGQPAQLETLRFCEVCLEQGFHSVIFQMPGLAFCPAHGTPLKERCTHCGLPIDYRCWSRREAVRSFECGCGKLLWPQRASVAGWYKQPRRINRLDSFAHRLLTLQRTSRTLWFRIDSLAVGVSQASTLAERLGAICPTELLKLPRIYRSFMTEAALASCVAREDLRLSAGTGHDPIAVLDWFTGLLKQVEHEVVSVLDVHRHCIKAVRGLADRDGPVLLLDQCALANSLLLWRAHWSDPVPRMELCKTVEWYVRVTVSALRERSILSDEESDFSASRLQSDTFPTISAVPPWRTLCEIFGRQLLICSLDHIANFVRKLYEGLEQSNSLLTHRSARGAWHPLQMEIPRVWAIFEPGEPEILQIRHGGLAPIRALNGWPCLKYSNSKYALDVSSRQNPLFREGYSLRGALDCGLSFRQLGVGQQRNGL